MSADDGAITVMAVGECMLELRHRGPSELTLSYAGDTYNIAVYLRRAATSLELAARVGYLSGVGDDPYSELMRRAWRAEQLEDHAVVVPGAGPGIYLVHAPGHRQRFQYWRSSSAASQLFSTPEWISGIRGDLIVISGITLQLMPGHVRNILLAHLKRLRSRGASVALDTNYRQVGWLDREHARRALTDFAAAADFVLATFDDEQLLFDDTTPRETLARYGRAGCPEVVVKLGGHGVLLGPASDPMPVPAVAVEAVIDTTAAGDSFGGTYLAARLAGLDPPASAALAVRVAAAVIGHPGAIAPPTATSEVLSSSSTVRRAASPSLHH